MSYFQVNDRCNGCLACVQNCPANALKAVDEPRGRTILHSMTRCARCGNCWRVCPQKAVEFGFLLENQWDAVKTLDLVRCAVCDTPVYTAAYGRTLSDALEHPVEALCPEHRDAWSKVAQAHFRPGRAANKEIKPV